MCVCDRLGRLRALVLIVLLAGLGAAPVVSAHAAIQTPPAAPPAGAPAPPAGQTPPAPAPPATPAVPGQPASGKPGTPPAGLTFVGDAGLALFTVKAEGAADFEAFFAKVKETLARSDKPEHKQMADGWTIFKVTDTLQAGQLLYVSVMSPATKGMDYDPVKILGEVSSADVTALYPKFKNAIISVNRLNLQPVMKMGQ
jgi:hypothetical protein